VRSGVPAVETSKSTLSVTGVKAGVPLQFTVTAVDLAGNESAPVAVTATPPVIPAPPALQKVARHGTTLRFSLTAAAKVRVSLRRAGRRATVKTRAYSAGRHMLALRRRVLGVKLTKGRWTVTLSVAGGKARAVRFNVRR
jgi:hypothetical protein